MKEKIKRRKKEITLVIIICVIILLFFSGFSMGKELSRTNINTTAQISKPILEVENGQAIEIKTTNDKGIYEFKVKNSAPNSIYIIYKNMPILQIIINIPFLLAGFLIKTLFFTVKGLGVVYVKGLRKGFSMCLNIKNRGRKVRFAGKNFRYYLKIQLELWINILRKVIFLFK